MGVRTVLVLVALGCVAASSSARTVYNRLPDGWEQKCMYENKHFGVKQEFPPTPADNIRLLKKHRDFNAPFRTFIRGLSLDAANKFAGCKNEISSFLCLESLWKMASDHASISAIFGLMKPKYMAYLRVTRIGFAIPVDINQFIGEEKKDILKQNCGEYDRLFSPRSFAPGGFMYAAAKKLFNSIRQLEDADAKEFKRSLNFLLQDVNVHSGNWCGLIPRLKNVIRSQLSSDQSDFHTCKLKCFKDDKIIKGLNANQIQIARTRALSVFNMFSNACTIANEAERSADYGSCDLLRLEYEGVQLPGPEEYISACKKILRSNNQVDGLCEKYRE